MGPATIWPGSPSRKNAEVADGIGNTLLVVENHGSHIPWTAPQDLELATMNLSVADQSPRGISSAYQPSLGVLADGRVISLPDGLSTGQLRALLTATGGEPYFDLETVPDDRLRPKR